MLTIRGMTLRYPASTAMALACAAHALEIEAGERKDKRRAKRFEDTCSQYLEGFGGLFATGDDVKAQRAAIEQLRRSEDARAEARAAITKRYRREVLPPLAWVVRGFGRLLPPIVPVNIAEVDYSSG
jgi:hypothetical protein